MTEKKKTQKKAEKVVATANPCDIQLVNFTSTAVNYRGAKPVSLSYKKKSMDSPKCWKQMYVTLIGWFHADYPDIIENMIGKNLNKAKKSDFSKSKKNMTSPVELKKGVFFETGYPVTVFLRKIQLIAKRCEIDMSDIKITFRYPVETGKCPVKNKKTVKK
jgi:hypothetical protein